ncbi:MAG TPA: allantoicase [Jiangellaceae bacterium]|nr:allantoicase [Jiangellaceae bacterium]
MPWKTLPDLAVRTGGGAVLLANDETFGEKENLIKPDVPAFQPHTFGHHGQVMDGWETRRRRAPGDDWAIVRLGIPGLVRGVIVDTAWFTGNYPPEVSVEAAWVDPLDSSVRSTDLVGPRVDWAEIVPRSPVRGDSENGFDVDHDHVVTHVRLRQYPDGGIARLRVHGEPVGDPRLVAGRAFDLAAMEHGAAAIDCSNRFYSAPDNLLVPGPVRVMGEGWETSRRRDDGNDWVVIRLATAGVVRHLEIDTSYFIGNAPGAVSIVGIGAERVELLPRTPVQPDAVNRFVLPLAGPVGQLRVDIFPDGGLARVRAWGEPSRDGRAAFFLRWYDRLPPAAAVTTLIGWGGAGETWAGALAARRPYDNAGALANAVSTLPSTPPEPSAWSALTGLEGA